MPAPSTASDILGFSLGGAASLAASALLASRLERVAGRLLLSEALLGMVAALAADSPEITSSITAMGSGQHAVGVGVVLGSNVFNIAALLGLGSIAAGRIMLHRRVILLEGSVALAIAAIAVLVAAGALASGVALAIALLVLIPYCVVIGVPARSLSRLPLPKRTLAWLALAVREEDFEIAPALPPRRSRPEAVRRSRLDAGTVVISLAAVVSASILMEHSGVALGARYRLTAMETGGLVLAAVTSLPNAVAAVYLARKGRGAAVLSEAMNSNALNVVAGLLIPAAVLGLGRLDGQSLRIAWWYVGLTVAALTLAFAKSGINRAVGALIVLAYGAFIASIVVM